MTTEVEPARDASSPGAEAGEAPPQTRTLSPEDVKAIKAAANIAGARLSYEDRLDLRQAVAVQILQYTQPIESVPAFALKIARNKVSNFFRDQSKQTELLREGQARGAVQTWRHGPNWSPTWYPPHPDAKVFAPFALAGARVMHVGGKGR